MDEEYKIKLIFHTQTIPLTTFPNLISHDHVHNFFAFNIIITWSSFIDLAEKEQEQTTRTRTREPQNKAKEKQF